MKHVYAFVISALIICSSHGFAMERFDIISTRDLAVLLEERQAGQIDFYLVNTLDELIANTTTIPGSINVPWGKADKLAAESFKNEYDTLIINYCMGYR